MFDHVDPNTRYGDEAQARGGLIALLARAALERAGRDAAQKRSDPARACEGMQDHGAGGNEPG